MKTIIAKSLESRQASLQTDDRFLTIEALRNLRVGQIGEAKNISPKANHAWEVAIKKLEEGLADDNFSRADIKTAYISRLENSW